jgi:ribosomal protein L12E/L44/L45/RPP1/RPP2
MAAIGTDETRLKELLKEALVEVLDQRREWFSALLTEALEDVALAEAIKEGEQTELMSREEIFAILGA